MSDVASGIWHPASKLRSHQIYSDGFCSPDLLVAELFLS